MNTNLVKRVLAVVTAVCVASGILTFAFAGGSHDEGSKLEHVVSLEGKSGLNLLLARWYNENRVVYALVVTATMAVLGIVVGQITEFTLRIMGVR